MYIKTILSWLHLPWPALPWLCAALLLAPTLADAHGYAGARFFPATIATDDPFVSDELSLPTVSTFRERATDDEPSTRVTSAAIDFAKRLTPRFGLGLGESYDWLRPHGESGSSGFNNLELSAKYLAYENDAHETLISVGVESELGHSGSIGAGSEHSTVISPSVYLGKGFGDLSASMGWLRPLAITGVLGYDIPTHARFAGERNPHVLNTGIAFEYSLPYLQAQVKNVGLSAPFDRLIPLVEVALSTPTDAGQRGDTTGTINPGVLWIGQTLQLGLEAVIPANHRSGKSVGAVFQLHWFLDDLFPHSLGAPLFGAATPGGAA